MPRDTKIPFSYDSTGDVETVSGTAFYEQHALQLGLIAIEDQLGEPLTANDTTEIESAIEREYSQSPYFETPLSVRIEDVGDDSITLGVRLGNGTEFTVPLTTRDTRVT